MCARRTATSFGSRSGPSLGRATESRRRGRPVRIGAAGVSGRKPPGSQAGGRGVETGAPGLAGGLSKPERRGSQAGGRAFGTGAPGMPDDSLSNLIAFARSRDGRHARPRMGANAPAPVRAGACPARSALHASGAPGAPGVPGVPGATKPNERGTLTCDEASAPRRPEFRDGCRRAWGAGGPPSGRVRSSRGRPGHAVGTALARAPGRRGRASGRGGTEVLPGASGQFSSNCSG